MFSHIVIFWTDPANPAAADELVAAANKYLRPIPGALHFHVGKMVPSHRPVVDQTYQVALNIIFADKKAQDDYHKQLFLECRNRLDSIATVHELIYKAKSYSHINFKDYLNQILDHFQKSKRV